MHFVIKVCDPPPNLAHLQLQFVGNLCGSFLSLNQVSDGEGRAG